MTYRIQLTVDGVIRQISRDATHQHPDAVHAAMGTSSETELQRALDGMNVSDWYDARGRHLGPDCDGLEMFDDTYYAEARGGETWEIFGPTGPCGSIECASVDMDDVLVAAQTAGLVPEYVAEIEERA